MDLDLCSTCNLDPCACDYIRTLAPGGPNAWLRDVAREQMGKPLPHRGGCPCPGCYSTRMQTFITAMASQPGRCRHGFSSEHTDHECLAHVVPLPSNPRRTA